MTSRYALCSRDEQLTALHVGARVLRERWPTVQARCMVDVSPNRTPAFAVWVWPGVVRITREFDGAFIARSKPGRPFELDDSEEA